VSRYQKVKTNLDFTEARDSEWQWHQLGHMQICTSLQTDSHASTSSLSFFTVWMPFLSPNQQRQSTEGTSPRAVLDRHLLYKLATTLHQTGEVHWILSGTVLSVLLLVGDYGLLTRRLNSTTVPPRPKVTIEH